MSQEACQNDTTLSLQTFLSLDHSQRNKENWCVSNNIRKEAQEGDKVRTLTPC